MPETTGINTLGMKDILLLLFLNVVDMIVLMIVMEEILLRWNTEEIIEVHMIDLMKEKEIDLMIEIILKENMKGLVEIIMIAIIIQLQEMDMIEMDMIEDLYLLLMSHYMLVEVDPALHHHRHVEVAMRGVLGIHKFHLTVLAHRYQLLVTLIH